MPAEPREAPPGSEVVVVGEQPLTIGDVVRVATGGTRVTVAESPEYRAKISAGPRTLREVVARGVPVYGVTTGFGDSCDNTIDAEGQLELARNLVRFHGCGTGRAFDRAETRAILLTRLASLARGYSAVRVEVLEQLAALLNHDLCPRIPAEGSVGASGDLTPLSYVAAVLLGEGEVLKGGTSVPALEALRKNGLAPVDLLPKESLALMNGTSVMTALTALGFDRARRLVRLASSLTALSVEAVLGEREQFDDRIFELKPHPGQRDVARFIREDLGSERLQRPESAKLQDRYSIRCAPHVIGVLADVLPQARAFLEVELNSVNDNPIIDVDSGRVLHSGNFYGGHVCHVADTLKACVASVADLMDRQLALVANPTTSNGLPRDLVSPRAPGGAAHHGFKAMQITASALTAEALKLTMPASAFSRSTENHNQDKVSMGTIAARDLLRILDLTETVAAVHLLSLCQAVDLRGGPRGPGCRALHAAVRSKVPGNHADRPMDADIAAVLEMYRGGALPVPREDVP